MTAPTPPPPSPPRCETDMDAFKILGESTITPNCQGCRTLLAALRMGYPWVLRETVRCADCDSWYRAEGTPDFRGGRTPNAVQVEHDYVVQSLTESGAKYPENLAAAIIELVRAMMADTLKPHITSTPRKDPHPPRPRG